MKKQIQHVYPPVGTTLTHKIRSGKGKSKIIYAEIVNTESKTGNGVAYDGKVFKSMTAAACFASGYTVNGWTYWKIEKEL